MVQPLRVLLVAQPVDGGVGQCVAVLAAGAVAAGVDVTVACPGGRGLAARATAGGADHVEVPLRRSPGWRDALVLARLRQLAAEHDVVHLHSSMAGALGRLSLGSLGPGAPPSVFTPHGWSWQAGGRGVAVYKRVERLLAARADVIVAVSEEERMAGEQVLGGRCRIRVIENGVDVVRFSPEGPIAARRPEPLVVCVGRLAYPKGQATAIDAMARITDSTARLRLVGDGPDRPALVGRARDLGVADRLELVGTADEPEAHLRAADVVVVPSSSEGMSLAMLEAMACGRPVVSTAVPGSGAIGAGGEVVPIGDAEAMARSIDGLLRHPDRRAAVGSAARRQVVRRYTTERMVAQNVDLWHEVAGHRLETSAR